MTPSSETQPAATGFGTDLKVGLGVWFFSSLIILGGAAFGWRFVKPQGGASDTFLEALRRWDGSWYGSVVESGYTFNQKYTSSVAFFPGYPLSFGAISWTTGASVALAQFVAAQLYLLAGFVVFHAYLRRRFPTRPDLPLAVLLTMAFFPPTFFFHMDYSESMFFFATTLVLLAAIARWPLLALAFVIGLATGVRPVGVALLPILIRETWFRSSTWLGFVGRSAALLPIACWGLLGYMAYLHTNFGDPLAFAKAQDAWNSHPDETFETKLEALLTLKPIWGSFIGDSGHFFPTKIDPSLDYIGASTPNAIVFIFGISLVMIGVCCRWLTWTEFLVAAALLGMPYLTRGFESQFLSFARFTAAALPIYIPLARLIQRCPRLIQLGILFIGIWATTTLASLFAAGYHIV